MLDMMMSNYGKERQQEGNHISAPKSHKVAWYPSCSSKLAVFDEEKLELNTVWSDPAGCNSHELVALIKIINAHKDYQDYQLQTAGARYLGEACRSAVQECLAGWEEEERKKQADISTADDNAASDTIEGSSSKSEQAGQRRNMELLKLSLAAMHLSDIFLPLLRPRHFAPSSEDFQEQYQGIQLTDAFHKPGAITAPMVRFLRYHYDSPALMHPDLSNMLQSAQPELYEDTFGANDLGGSLYWNYVEALVWRGCLAQAWQALARHSSYQYAMGLMENDDENDPFLVEMAREIIRGFRILKRIFAVAPLPGGTSDTFDDLVVKNHEMEQDDLDIAMNEEDDDNDDEYGVDLRGLRVTSQDYTFWELGRSGDSNRNNQRDLPVEYVAEAALRKHQDWQRYIQEQILPNFPLLRRIPELNRIFDILTGQWDTTKMEMVAASSWAEHLCACLIYQNPAIKPRQVPALAYRFMMEYSNSNQDDDAAENHVLLDIMEGRASQSIDVLYSLGGASGAALPSTLLAVIFTLYLDANILPPESAVRQREFLCLAAEAIISSLADAETPDTATSLAVQLLIPHLDADDISGDGDNDEIPSCLALILEHYFPQSDAGARDIISLVMSAVFSKIANGRDGSSNRRGLNVVDNSSLPLVEACETVALSRFEYYRSNNQPGIAVQWLVEGMSCRSRIGGLGGSCRRTLCALCNSFTSNLLHIMTGAKMGNACYSRIYHDTEDTVAAIRERMSTITQGSNDDDNAMLALVSEVQVLLRVQELVEAFVIDKDYSLSAKQVVACLEESKVNASNHVGRFIPLSMHWPLLLVAKEILREEACQEYPNVLNPVSAFDQKGICVLMESLLQVAKHYMGACSSMKSARKASFATSSWRFLSESELGEMHSLLAHALARACVAENAKKKILKRNTGRSEELAIASIPSMDLVKHPIDVQQAVVRNMLDL
ncbi:hypothetical protein ACA910_000576 [Epithemia clementina (nom. ined.)]